MNNKLKILVCAVLVIALVGVAYAGSSASQNAPGQMKKPRPTTIPTTVPTTVPTPIPTQLPNGNLINDPSNPVMPHGSFGGIANIETSILQDPNNPEIIDNWYRTWDGSHSSIWYAYATNEIGNNWQSPVRITDIPLDYGLPYIIYDKTTAKWYMFVAGDISRPNIYLYSSNNKINWNVMNGGNPVLLHGTTPATTQIFNPGVAIVNDSYWVMLIEGKAPGSSTFVESYAYSNLAELDWTKHLTSVPVINPGSGYGAGNPYLVSVPERNAILVVTGYTTGGYWKVGTLWADTSTDLTNPTNWHYNGDLISYQGIHVADPSVAFVTGKTHPIIVQFNYNQEETYQKYGDLPLANWFDYLKAGG